MKAVVLMIKAIHSQESKEAFREKAIQVAEKLNIMELAKAAQKIEDGIEEILIYMDFPIQRWTWIQTNNTIERFNHEIKCGTKVIGAFPDGQSVLILICAIYHTLSICRFEILTFYEISHHFCCIFVIKKTSFQALFFIFIIT